MASDTSVSLSIQGAIAQYAPEYNLTSGGDGGAMFPEVIARIRATQTTPEKIEFFRELAKKQWQDPKHRARMTGKGCKKKGTHKLLAAGQLTKERWKDPEFRTMATEAHSASWTKEKRDRHREITRNRFLDPARNAAIKDKAKTRYWKEYSAMVFGLYLFDAIIGKRWSELMLIPFAKF